MITPKLIVSSNQDSISFWLKTPGYYQGTTMSILVSTTDNQISSFSSTSLLQLASADITTTWTRHSASLSDYIGQDIHIAFKVVDSYGMRIMLDDIQGPTIFVPACPKPITLTASNPSVQGIDLGWIDDFGSLWNIQYMLSSQSDWSSSTLISGITNPYTFSNLDASTTYKVRVQSDCGEEQSDWSAPIVFSTSCVPITTLPYTENFDYYGTVAGSFPPCWSRPVLNTSTPFPSIVTTNHSSPASIQFQSFSSSDPTFLVTPQFDDDVNTLRVKFWAKAEHLTNSGRIEVGAMSDPTDISTFKPVASINPSTINWTQYEVQLNDTSITSMHKYIAFKHITVSSAYLYWIDDVVVDFIPSCPDVYGFVAQAATPTSVSVNWILAGDQGDGYNIAYEINPVSSFDPSTAIVLSIPSGVQLPYLVDGFYPGDTVWIAVQRGCSGAWTDAQRVILPASALTLPFISDFENPAINSKWILTNGTQANKWYIGAPGANGESGNGLYISNDGGINSSYNNSSSSTVYASLLLDLGDSPAFELSFDWLNQGEYGQDGIDVFLLPISEDLVAGTTLGSTYKLNTLRLTNQNTFQTYTKTLDNSYSNTLRQLVFAWRNDGSDGANPPARIDNISFLPLSCGMPYNLSMDSASYNGTSVHLSWEEPQVSNAWIIEYQKSGTPIWNQVEANTNPYTLTGLEQGTIYQARVRSICSVGDTSGVSNQIAIQTECLSLIVPTPIEEFTSVPPSICWTRKSGLLMENSTLLPVSTGWGHSSKVTPNNAKLNIFGTSRNHWLISPSIYLGDGSSPSQLEFDLFFTGYSNDLPASTNAIDDRFAVVVSTDNGLSWSQSNAIIWSNEVGAEKVLNNITNIPSHIVLPLINPQTDLPYTGNIKIEFYGESTILNGDNDIHIDNFEVRPYTLCTRPANIMASNITTTEATISFIEGDEAVSWEYVYGETNLLLNPSSGAPIALGQNTIQLTGLTSQTQYNIWIRSICGETTSDWSEIYTFTTQSLPASIPYICNFEDDTENLGWKRLQNGVNAWAVGTAAGNSNTSSGTKSYYISNDGGLTYGINAGMIYAYTYRDIDFGTQTSSFDLEFDWKCLGGEAGGYTMASLVVYLQDPATPISPNGLPSNQEYPLGMFNGETTWQTAQVPIENISGTKRLIFLYYDGNINATSPAAIDNISIQAQSCIKPTNIVASNITTTGAEISWTHPGADSYIVSYYTINNPSLVEQPALTSPLALNNLSQATEYIVGVMAICGLDTTDMSQTLSFATECYDGPISTFPWNEDFESGIICWSQEYNIGTTNWTNSSDDTSPHTGTGYASFFNTSGGKTKLISPILDLSGLTQPYISFWHTQEEWYGSQDELKVFYRLSPEDTWTELEHYTTNIPTYRLDSISLPNPSSTYQIAFEGFGDYGYGIGLDDISVYNSTIIPCIAPSNLVVLPEITTANITWTAAGQEDSWEIRLGTNGTPETTTTTTHTLTNLSPATDYTVYIRANCGQNYSPWISSDFTTNANPTPPIVTTSVPFSQITQTTAVFSATYVETFDPIQTKGFQYKETAANNWIEEEITEGNTPFTFTAISLTQNTEYEVRAYVGTDTYPRVYGEIITFITLSHIPPIVITEPVTNITQNSVDFNGFIQENTEPIEARGFEYKISTEEWTDAVDISAEGTTNITATASPLDNNFDYDVRAYARTLSGKTYGDILRFEILGLNDANGSEISVMIYPNPATSQTNLVINGISGETKIILSDVQGRVLKTIDTKPLSGQIEQSIDLNNLAKGVYYIRIQNTDINRTQKLIVK